jgi:hypothetical protein
MRLFHPLLYVLVSTILASCQEQSESVLHDRAVSELKGDLPPIGRSLFDILTMRELSPGVFTQAIPFPFTELRQVIEKHTSSPAQVTLIPRGRSLQRLATSEPFKFPRVVLAVTSEPAPSTHHAPLLLKDRLYLGYVEATDQIEVLSFNPVAGRFEFQIVEDYGPGKKPVVRYANRSFCLACHQNEAPIFSLPPWDETVANPRLAARVLEAHAGATTYLGIPIRQFSTTPNAIDESTDRATVLPANQKLWYEGCQQDRIEDIKKCRRLVLELALNYVWDQDLPQSLVDEYQALSAASWAVQWSSQLNLVSPNIPNYFNEKEVAATADPLQDRRTVSWQEWKHDQGDSLKVVFGVVENLLATDVEWLQSHKNLKNTIISKLHTWEAEVTSALTQSSFDRCQWLIPLLSPITSDSPVQCDRSEAVQWPHPVTTGSHTSPVSQGLAPFITYCGRCHQSGPRPFLAGTEETAIWKNLRASAHDHFARLDWKNSLIGAMPPSGSPERIKLEAAPDDRSQMLEILREGSP